MSWQRGDDPRAFIVKEIFQDSYNYMKSGTLMRQVINVIDNEIDFNNSKQTHIFNDIYEKILKDLQSAGNAGEYYTPRAVTRFIVEMVNLLNPRTLCAFMTDNTVRKEQVCCTHIHNIKMQD